MTTLLAATLLTFAPAMGADHPSGPVYNEGWTKGIAELVNGKNRVHGYFVNWSDVFFFKGDAQAFNVFLKDYANLKGAQHRLILHTGTLYVRSPWDEKLRGLTANWRLITHSLKMVRPTTPEPERELLELWLSNDLTEKKLTIPANIDVVKP